MILHVVFANPIDGDPKVVELILEIPLEPDKWVFQGNSSGVSRNGRISNGQQATDTQFPWVAELAINLNNGGLLCTASLISDQWILGARHCIAE